MTDRAAAQITVSSDSKADPSSLSRWTEQLTAELRAVGLRPSRPIGAVVPETAKSDGVTLTQLIVSVASSGVLVAVVQTVQSFVTRARGSKVHIEVDGDSLELDNVDDDQRRQIVDAWLTRHGDNQDPAES